MMRLKSKVVIISVLLLLLSGCAGNRTETSSERPPYLVHITAGAMSGSGIIYSVDDGWMNVLTAAHVVEDMPTARPAGSDMAPSATGASTDKGAEISFCDGGKVFCREILVSEVADLAMLRLPLTRFAKKQLEGYACVSVDKKSFDALSAEDVCRAVGFGQEMETLQYEGSILEPWIYMEDYGQYMIWARAEIRSGMSGGGLFDQNGCLIGILSGGSEDGELAAIPYSLILQFLETAEVRTNH